MEIKKLIKLLADIADKKKAENIKVFEVKEKVWITDYVMLVGVKNPIHSKAILGDLSKEISKLISPDQIDYYRPPKVSGTEESGWVILDLNSIIIHCIDDKTREQYDIDQLFEKQGITYHY